MKKIFFISCLILCFCSTEESGSPKSPQTTGNTGGNTGHINNIIGVCDTVPEPLNVLFKAQGGIDTITVNTRFLLEHYLFGKGCADIYNTPDYCDNNYCIFSNGFVMVDEVLVNGYNGSILMRIECPWFNVTHIDTLKILVSVNQNETGEERQESIGMSKGNCGSNLTIIQSAD